jgi:hypothetical protein
VAKFNPAGDQLIYSVIFGGSGSDAAYALAVDSQGNAWVTGETNSANFPATNTSVPFQGDYDTFVAKVSPTGQVTAAALLGYPNSDKGNAIAVDPQGNAYIVGEMAADYGPAVAIAKVNPAIDDIAYRGYFGQAERGFQKGSRGQAAAVDASGRLYIAGTSNSLAFEADGYLTKCVEDDGYDCTFEDGFVAVVNAAGTSVEASTFLGGHGSDQATGIAVDAQGSIYVTGTTFAGDFPTLNPWQATRSGPDNFAEGFLTKLTPNASALVYSTYYGGTSWDEPHAVKVDANGRAVVAGLTNSLDLPVPGGVQTGISGICNLGGNERYCYDAFVASFDAAGGLQWGTFLGGGNDDFANSLALGSDGSVYVAGGAESHAFPTTSGSVQPDKSLLKDAFLVKLGAGGQYRAFLPFVSAP